MKILLLSDKVNTAFVEKMDRKNFADIKMVISCGDLPSYYLNYIVDCLDVPCFYVPGNHDSALEKKPPLGWMSLHNRLIEWNNIVIGGIGGSPWYNNESIYQYTEMQMYTFVQWMRYRVWRKKRLDILVTHSPAYGLGDIKGSRVHQGFKSLLTLLEKTQPKLFVHGHTHLNYGVHRVHKHRDTWLVNAYNHYIIDLNNLESLQKLLKTP